MLSRYFFLLKFTASRISFKKTEAPWKSSTRFLKNISRNKETKRKRERERENILIKKKNVVTLLFMARRKSDRYVEVRDSQRLKPKRKTFKSIQVPKPRKRKIVPEGRGGEEGKRTICGETKAAFLPPKLSSILFYHFSRGLLHIFPTPPHLAPRSQLLYSQRTQASAYPFP